MAIAILLAVAIGFGFLPTETDGSLASEAVQTVVGKPASLSRVTETTFRMSPASATLCVSLPTQQPPHVGYHCHVFANQAARKPILSGKEGYPVGSVIVKQKFYSRFAQKTALFTIMRKMDNGYDEANGNWEYSVVDATGEQLISKGKKESCISCHTHYRETDFVTRAYLDL